jgi:hypothetical protein
MKSVTYIRAINGADYSCLPEAEHQEVVKLAPTPREKDWLALIDPSPAYSFYFSRISGPPSSDAVIGEQSPLSHIKFNPFRPLGFAFWIQERMLGCGLLRPMPGQPHWPRRTITLTSTTTPGKASSAQMILLK